MTVSPEPSRRRWHHWPAQLGARLRAALQTPDGLARCVALAALLPTPVWFLLVVLADTGPVWRAVYHEKSDFSGQQALVTERRLSRYWDTQNRRVPGAFSVRQFSAVFDTCLELREPRAIPFQLVVNGAARLSIDGQERLRAGRGPERDTRGEVLELPAGTHHLRVELSPEGWTSIALNASLDGRAPVAVPPEEEVPGVSWFQPRSGAEPCSR
jgi:hypothetical protein